MWGFQGSVGRALTFYIIGSYDTRATGTRPAAFSIILAAVSSYHGLSEDAPLPAWMGRTDIGFARSVFVNVVA